MKRKPRRPRAETILAIITTHDLAELFGVSTRTINRWIENGRLPITGLLTEDLQTLTSLLAQKT